MGSRPRGRTRYSWSLKVRQIRDSRFVVLELSSFMLEDLQWLRPHIACITNVAEDHVDRYADFGEYVAAKLNLLRYCGPDDVFVRNLDDRVLRDVYAGRMKVRTVSRLDGAERMAAGYAFHAGRFHFGGETLSYSDCRLRGVHNIENILMALAIGCESGVDPRQAAAAVREFPPVPHRFEPLGRWGAVEVYNDSKATTVHAVERAVESLGGNVVLIAGGRGKGLDFSPLREHRAAIKRLVCYGESGQEIRQTVDVEHSHYTYRFADAVEVAAKSCSPGDFLLLSPGCTSWDQHRDYAERGREFAELAAWWLGRLHRSGRPFVPPPGASMGYHHH